MIIATLTALLVMPLLVLRGRTLAAYFATDLTTTFIAALIWLRVADIEPRLGFVALSVVKLATFSVFLANGRQVQWSVNRAALLAAIVYGLTIPAMLVTPIDGDEPYYLLVTDSLARDLDLDLANQYRADTGAAWGRPGLVPQAGDPTGRRGQQYSRHEPFLSLLMVPGYLLAGLHGAIATVALFGVLLVRSTLRWMEDEGIAEQASRVIFPLFAFAPPVLFYATRIWPEVPAAFFFVEALRGVRQHRAKRWLPALLGLVLLKLRFVLVAAGVIAAGRRKRAALLLLVPLLTIWSLTGNALNVHRWRELVPTAPLLYLHGLLGLLVDGMSGIAFQAPVYLFALFALLHWQRMPDGFRKGVLASLLYLFYLVPRGEWFGGWAPPLRYIVFLMPVLALGLAAVWERVNRGALALACAWTVGLVIHGLHAPRQLFHEFTGETAAGEWLSKSYQSDFSRFFPSFIRVNTAAWWWACALIAALALAYLLSRFHPRAGLERGRQAPLLIAMAAVLLAALFHSGREPGAVVHFEDAHVAFQGGRLYPDEYTMMRATYRGGRILEAGDSVSFLARAGTHTLHFITGLGATFEVGRQAYSVPADVRYQAIRVTIPRAERVTLRCLSGAVNLDRMDAQR